MAFTVFLPQEQVRYGDEDTYDFLEGGILKIHSDTRFQPAGTAVYRAPGTWETVGAEEGHDPGKPKKPFHPPIADL